MCIKKNYGYRDREKQVFSAGHFNSRLPLVVLTDENHNIFRLILTGFVSVWLKVDANQEDKRADHQRELAIRVNEEARARLTQGQGKEKEEKKWDNFPEYCNIYINISPSSFSSLSLT